MAVEQPLGPRILRASTTKVGGTCNREFYRRTLAIRPWIAPPDDGNKQETIYKAEEEISSVK